MANLYMIKLQNGTFAPADDDSFDTARKFKAGQTYPVKIWIKRNTQFHKKFFALLKEIYQNQDTYTNINDLRVEILLKTGFYDEHITMKGQIIYLPKSMSFENMDNVDFENLYNKTIDIAISDFRLFSTAIDADEHIKKILHFV